MTPTGFGSTTVARVLKGRLCSGCGLCAGRASDSLRMELSDEGFLRPAAIGPVPETVEAEIAAACPGNGLEQHAEGRPDDLLWGPVLEMHTGHSTDPDLRFAASSGGALSALLVHLLESGAVEGVLHVGADPERPIGNQTVLSRNRDDVLIRAGSRYAPSAPLSDLEHWLSSGGTYAFVGKPCDVSALRTLACHDARVNERFPYMISFFCAGVPGLAGARGMLEHLETSEEDLVAFRYRGNGWPGLATATRTDGSTRQMTYAESWGNILSRHVQFRCKICPDGTGGFADVVCADAWETDVQGYPLLEERDGSSLVVTRTDKGAALVQAAVDAGGLSLGPFNRRRLMDMQPGQTFKRRVLLARILALRFTLGPVPRYRGFHLVRNAARAGVSHNLRSFVGTLRRVVSGRY